MSHSTPTGPDRDRRTNALDTPPLQSPLTPRTDQGVARGGSTAPKPNFFTSPFLDHPPQAAFPYLLEDCEESLVDGQLALSSPDPYSVDNLPPFPPISTIAAQRQPPIGTSRAPEQLHRPPLTPYRPSAVPYHFRTTVQHSDSIPTALSLQPAPLRSVAQSNQPIPQPPFLGVRRPIQLPPIGQHILQQNPNVRDPTEELPQNHLADYLRMHMTDMQPRTPQPVFRSPPGLSVPPARVSNAFRPMAALEPSGRSSNLEERGLLSVNSPAFSSNYHGEHSIRNASVESLSPEENCALWLTNLPPDVTHRELLGSIRKIGRIWCTVVNEPDYQRHNTAAAKVVFFTPGPAQHLLMQSLTQGLRVRNYPVRVMHNRVKYAESPTAGGASRVLLITGKSDFVNEASLTEFFKKRFLFEVDEVIPLVNKLGRSVVEYRFGSYRCQAQMGKMALEKDRPEGFEKVEFGEDPCEVGDSFNSLDLAMRRIKGQYE